MARPPTAGVRPESDAAGEAPPRVSVVTIVLNGERFLAEAIESVLAQTCTAWELIVVDDGSTDRSVGIATAYADRLPGRVRVVRHPDGENRGMSASRNLGIRLARGEYLAFLDADDVYLPEKLEHQAARLVEHPEADIVYGATEYWFSWTGRADDRHRDRERRRGVPAGTLWTPPELLVRFLADEARTPCTCGVLVRKAAVDRVGGFEESFRGMFEDQVFFFKLALHGTYFIDDRCLDRYRQHAGSAVSRGRARSGGPDLPTPERLRFLGWVDEYLRDDAVADADVARAARWLTLPYRRPNLARLRDLAHALLAPARAWRRRRHAAGDGRALKLHGQGPVHGRTPEIR